MIRIYAQRDHNRLATQVPVEGRIYNINLAAEDSEGRFNVKGLGTVAVIETKSTDLSEAENLLDRVTQALQDGATISREAKRLIPGLIRS